MKTSFEIIIISNAHKNQTIQKQKGETSRAKL